MPRCPNCGTALDPVRTKIYHRETFYCMTDEAGRISVACSTIRELQDKIELLESKVDNEEPYMKSWPDDEGL